MGIEVFGILFVIVFALFLANTNMNERTFANLLTVVVIIILACVWCMLFPILKDAIMGTH